MNVRTQVALLAVVVLAPRAFALATPASTDELSAIDVHPSAQGGTVVLRGSHPPVFSVFRLSAPDRIIVDLAGADVSKAKAPARSGIQGVGEISAIQFQKGETRVGRVVLNADPALAYDVKVIGNDVVVALSGGAAHEAQGKLPADEAVVVVPSSQSPEAKPAVGTGSLGSLVVAQDEHLIARVVDEGPGGQVGHRVLGATASDQRGPVLTIRTDGPVGSLTLLRLKEPNRIAVDLVGFDAKGAKGRALSGASAIRFGKTSAGTRVVFDLAAGDAPDVVWHRTTTGLTIAAKAQTAAPAAVAQAVAPAPSKQERTPGSSSTAQVVPAPPVDVSAPKVVASRVASNSQKPTPVPAAIAVEKSAAVVPSPEVAPAKVASKPAPVVAVSQVPNKPTAVPGPMPSTESQVERVVATKHGKAPKAATSDVHDLRLTGDATVQEIVLELPSGAALPSPKLVEGGGYELQLHGISVPDKLRRTLDATAFSGPISTVSSYNVGQSEGRVVVSAAVGTRQELKQDGSTVTWRFTKPAETAQVSIDGAKVASMQTEQAEPQVAGFTTAAAETANELPRRTHYTGRRISLEFKDIDIQNLLRLFADISHKNVVVADDVKGKVTIALRNVPWDQAFDLILKTHGLGKEESGNIVRVAPEHQLDDERKAALEAKKARDLLEPLRVRLIPVNYALAGDVADKIKDVLSERGVVTVDGRTNVLIVKDVADNLAKAEGMVRNLDTQTPQVLIEARIVEASTQFNREVGIQWGGNGGFSPVNANSTGLVFPSTATVAGAAGGTPNIGTAANPNFAVNLPAAIGQGAGGGLGFIFGSAGGAVNLNLRISALEANGIVKTVSAPKVATLDNQEATISQGVSIPFAQVSAAGVQTAFIEARLELKVTPHVTSDGSVLLKISATNNQPNSGITGANGQPSISRKEAKTNMLVRDGDTSVIGGIYTRQTGVSVNQVPLFGSIPILGWLFKHRADTDARTELLVFITPRILNRQQIVASGN